MKTAKVVSCTFEKTWTSGRGEPMDQYLVQMDNDDCGQTSVKGGNPPPWDVGQTAEYDVVPSTNPHFPPKLKKVYHNRGGSGGGGSPRKGGYSGRDYLTEYFFKVPTTAIMTAQEMIQNGAVKPTAFIKCAESIQEWLVAQAPRMQEASLKYHQHAVPQSSPRDSEQKPLAAEMHQDPPIKDDPANDTEGLPF